MLADNLGFMQSMARTYGDVARYRVGNLDVYQVNHPGGIQRVLQENHHNYGKGSFAIGTMKAALGNGLVMSEGDFWLRQRRLMQPVFHHRSLARLAEDMVAAALSTRKDWEGSSTVDLSQEMMRLTLDIATQAMFSTRVVADNARLSQAFTTLMEDISFRFQNPLYPPLALPTPRNRRFRQALAFLDGIIHNIIQERRQLTADLPLEGWPGDLLSLLMQAQDAETGERMSDRQLRDEVVTLFGAGHETTAKTLTWCWYLLATHPQAEANLHAELESVLGGRPPALADLKALPYTRMVIEETLRLFPPAWITSRQATGEDELCGYHVPAGTLIWISPYVMHRHPEYWEDPDTFIPERFDPDQRAERPRFAYFPFGGGPHLCIGRDFALMEAQLVLATLAQRYRLGVQPGQKVEPLALVTLQPRGGLTMTLQPRR
jgi:cytochrome P450